MSADVDSVVMTFATPRGPQKQTLLITADNTKLYIAVDGPIDASKTAKELAEAAEQEKTERKTALAAAAKALPARGNPDAKVTERSRTDDKLIVEAAAKEMTVPQLAERVTRNYMDALAARGIFDDVRPGLVGLAHRDGVGQFEEREQFRARLACPAADLDGFDLLGSDDHPLVVEERLNAFLPPASSTYCLTITAGSSG